jgi:hypothetical protein
MDVLEALRAHGEAGAAVVDLLYGEGAEEVVKALSEDRKRKIATASNVVGIGAGLAAIPGATRDFRNAAKTARGASDKPVGVLKPVGKIRGNIRGGLKATKNFLGKPKTALALAGGGLALQAGNVGGDFVTNQVLRADQKKSGVSKGLTDIEWTGEFSKMDTDKRQVFGWASVTAVDGVPVTDLQEDEIDLEEIEKAAYSYVAKSRVGGNMHKKTIDGSPVHVSDMIESFVVTPEKKQTLHLGNDTPEGWWVGFQVNDDETWDAAKNGELVGFSIHGTGKRRDG